MGDHPLNPLNWNAQQIVAVIIFVAIVFGIVWGSGGNGKGK